LSFEIFVPVNDLYSQSHPVLFILVPTGCPAADFRHQNLWETVIVTVR